MRDEVQAEGRSGEVGVGVVVGAVGALGGVTSVNVDPGGEYVVRVTVGTSDTCCKASRFSGVINTDCRRLARAGHCDAGANTGCGGNDDVATEVGTTVVVVVGGELNELGCWWILVGVENPLPGVFGGFCNEFFSEIVSRIFWTSFKTPCKSRRSISSELSKINNTS